VEKLFQPAFQLPARQEDSTPATLAPQADIGAQTDDRPIKAPAGVRFLEPHHIADGKRNRL
jgi:hypothetical protein